MYEWSNSEKLIINDETIGISFCYVIVETYM
jgi:hypothetical protein